MWPVNCEQLYFFIFYFLSSQHHRYVGKTYDYRGTYIASEAPILLRNVSLVDPADRYGKPGRTDLQLIAVQL